jgi:hypothetical protein
VLQHDADGLRLLTALNAYQTWHSPSFLAGKNLIDPEWPREYADKLAEALERLGLAETRYSIAKGMMYKITAAGQLRLMEIAPERILI